MKVYLERRSLQTKKEQEIINITSEIEEVVTASGMKNGMVFILTLHTTTGITVNEGLPCLEKDILNTLTKLIPDDGNYYHAHYLAAEGRLGVNAECHLRGMLLGYNAFFPIEGGRIVKGGRQNVYFIDLDGPQYRNYVVEVIGD